jgi:hypothetical protein
MNVPEHKRYLYTYAGSNSPQVGVVEKLRLYANLPLRVDVSKYDTIEAAYCGTFNHGSRFVRWLDEEWVTS